MSDDLFQVFFPHYYEGEEAKTEFPDVEPGVRNVLDAFYEVWHERTNQKPGPTLRRRWVSGARDWYEEHGEKTELLKRTMLHMHEQGLTVADPRSCITEAYKLQGESDNDGPRGKIFE